MDSPELVRRAEELSVIAEPTPEQIAEMASLAEQLETAHAETVKKERAEETKRRLQAAAQNVTKESAAVPPENRPDSAYAVSTARTSLTADGYPMPAIKRPDYTVRELKETTYNNYRSIGYNDETIGIAATDAYARQVSDYMKSGGKFYGELVTKAMTTAGEGEVLIPIQWQELITQPRAQTMLRAQCRNITVGSQFNRFPRILSDSDKYSSHVRVEWSGETPNSLVDQGSAIQTDFVDISPHEVYCSGDFSISMFEDNAYGMQSMVPELMSDALDVDLESKIFGGTGTNQPWGLREKPSTTRVVPEIKTTTRGTITYSDLVRLKKAVHQKFRADGVWVFNSNTWELLAQQVDDNGRPLFQEYATSGMTNMPGGGQTWWSGTLLGRPYIIAETCPSIGDAVSTDDLPFIYYADWKNLYFLVNRVGATVKVLDQPKYQQGLYVFVLRARIGGRTIQPKAGAAMSNRSA